MVEQRLEEHPQRVDLAMLERGVDGAYAPEVRREADAAVGLQQAIKE